MADSVALLAQRLQALQEDGVKVQPATANPAPLGLFGFALTTALLQGAKSGLTEPGTSQLAISFGFFFGGLAQFCAGLLEYQRKNTFGTVAFCCYGAFWMSLAIFTTLSAAGVYGQGAAATITKGDRLMLSLWGILTFLLWLCTFHTNIVTCWLFFSLAILFWLLAAGVGNNPTITKFAGGWGFMVAATAFYDGTAALMKDVYGKQILPVFPLKPVNRVSLGDFGTKRFVDPEAAAKA
ncbi:hypothetical protein ABPG75_011805 [Micractinium tetrahymenae]